jgi:hypothetical protein
VSEQQRADERRFNAFAKILAGSTWLVEALVKVAAYGEVVWSWHPLLMLSLAEAKPAQPGEVAVNPLGDGDKKEFVAEESTKETVKTIARGKPGDFRWYSW